MKAFLLSLSLALLALQGTQAKVSSCLTCTSIDSSSECAKGTGSGLASTLSRRTCTFSKPSQDRRA